ncbi:DNA replication regulator SLD2 [Psilocybe cubensis]|uniref:DNA replication regulator SLD2 n=2 Tax=Psilocybe cubensis TaxID=181762 RepID=A0A8H8CPH6_PSICU|nr:DNA replication regulator SLD2 [Psilocybe cubensis]KAH9486578.1 DNA replication regulator SLD2 [Psilocybe cubensis]
MAEVATVRAHIKAWERSFKDANGRPPTVDDIKKNPTIANQYKQYKKLSKAAASSNRAQDANTAAIPSTPPRKARPKDLTSLLLSKSRPIQPPTPLVSFNPFSPQKMTKGKQKERDSANEVEDASNPFFQSDSTKCVVRKASPGLSPSPLPYRPLAVPTLNSDPKGPNLSSTAVSRARKRLRGEPVSPSPNKGKRMRVSSQTTLPFPRLRLNTPTNDDDTSGIEDIDPFVVDNSPVKATIPGKSYQQLFQPGTLPVNLFGVKDIGEAVPNNSGSKISRHTFPSNERPSDPAAYNANSIYSKISSSHLIGGNGTSLKSEPLDNRSSVKRAFSEEEKDPDVALPREKSPLIPPSPPPIAAMHKSGKTKINVKGATSRKKAKIETQMGVGDDSDDPDYDTTTKLRIIGHNKTRRQHALTRQEKGVVDYDSDPILELPRFAAPRAQYQDNEDNAPQQDGNIEIDLPDELRRVLALQSAGSKTQVSEEDRLVKGLLYGRRTNHYDPQKGGEIWDVGEHVDENYADNEGEDDWEGEPVPWAVGEL